MTLPIYEDLNLKILVSTAHTENENKCNCYGPENFNDFIFAYLFNYFRDKHSPFLNVKYLYLQNLRNI